MVLFQKLNSKSAAVGNILVSWTEYNNSTVCLVHSITFEPVEQSESVKMKDEELSDDGPISTEDIIKTFQDNQSKKLLFSLFITSLVLKTKFSMVLCNKYLSKCIYETY
jgi:hypothetical protein